MVFNFRGLMASESAKFVSLDKKVLYSYCYSIHTCSMCTCTHTHSILPDCMLAQYNYNYRVPAVVCCVWSAAGFGRGVPYWLSGDLHGEHLEMLLQVSLKEEGSIRRTLLDTLNCCYNYYY